MSNVECIILHVPYGQDKCFILRTVYYMLDYGICSLMTVVGVRSNIHVVPYSFASVVDINTKIVCVILSRYCEEPPGDLY